MFLSSVGRCWSHWSPDITIWLDLFFENLMVPISSDDHRAWGRQKSLWPQRLQQQNRGCAWRVQEGKVSGHLKEMLSYLHIYKEIKLQIRNSVQQWTRLVWSEKSVCESLIQDYHEAWDIDWKPRCGPGRNVWNDWRTSRDPNRGGKHLWEQSEWDDFLHVLQPR